MNPAAFRRAIQEARIQGLIKTDNKGRKFRINLRSVTNARMEKLRESLGRYKAGSPESIICPEQIIKETKRLGALLS